MTRPSAMSPALPPLAWLVAPLVVGLLAAGGFAWDRHAHRPPAWCRHVVPTLEAMDEIGTGSATPAEVQELADAAAAVDFPALVAEAPTEVRSVLAGRDAQWARFVANARSLPPGGSLFQVVPLGLTEAFTTLGDQRNDHCEVL